MCSLMVYASLPIGNLCERQSITFLVALRRYLVCHIGSLCIHCCGDRLVHEVLFMSESHNVICLSSTNVYITCRNCANCTSLVIEIATKNNKAFNRRRYSPRQYDQSLA